MVGRAMWGLSMMLGIIIKFGAPPATFEVVGSVTGPTVSLASGAVAAYEVVLQPLDFKGDATYGSGLAEVSVTITAKGTGDASRVVVFAGGDQRNLVLAPGESWADSLWGGLANDLRCDPSGCFQHMPVSFALEAGAGVSIAWAVDFWSTATVFADGCKRAPEPETDPAKVDLFIVEP